eukprot:Mrub_10986.p1 GENE.Mrub_10986~~Mrub_10986.p1  ORF type:complete len:178 (-),score=21.10 Mrub_10986:109-615(-)
MENYNHLRKNLQNIYTNKTKSRVDNYSLKDSINNIKNRINPKQEILNYQQKQLQNLDLVEKQRTNRPRSARKVQRDKVLDKYMPETFKLSRQLSSNRKIRNDNNVMNAKTKNTNNRPPIMRNRMMSAKSLRPDNENLRRDFDTYIRSVDTDPYNTTNNSNNLLRVIDG